jgi:hypothetical protein
MMTAKSPADTRMMAIVHAAFRRDLARVRLLLTVAPAPQGDRRQAVADQVVWLMDRLHANRATPDHTESAGTSSGSEFQSRWVTGLVGGLHARFIRRPRPVL